MLYQKHPVQQSVIEYGRVIRETRWRQHFGSSGDIVETNGVGVRLVSINSIGRVVDINGVGIGFVIGGVFSGGMFVRGR